MRDCTFHHLRENIFTSDCLSNMKGGKTLRFFCFILVLVSLFFNVCLGVAVTFSLEVP